MTPAELQKTKLVVTADRSAMPAVKMEAVSTIESVPRPPSEQGMTPQERAKRDAVGAAP